MIWIRERAVARENEPHLPGFTPDADRLQSWVELLAIPRHNSANTRNNARVREQLAATFDSYGLSVQIQGRYRNVVALPRETTERPVVFIAAHYDSVPDCPGADDNASGLSVMLECARVLASMNRTARLPVGFIAFNAEEDGLLGSHDFVKNGLPQLDVRVASVHVLEMVGFRGRSSTQQSPLWWAPKSLDCPDFIGVVAKGRSNTVVDSVLTQRVSRGLRVVGAKTWGPLHRIVPDLTRSDHFPFWSAGMPAVLWTDTGNFRNPHYHRFTDRPDTLDYEFMKEVAELLCATVLEGTSR
jgi:Zn-dependent M28 family amino/carboxypeptidase